MSCREASARAASFSSILDMANPTWMSTQSPGSSFSSSSKPILMMRVTPETSTLARCSCTSDSSCSCPGMPRHMVLVPFLDGEDLDPDLHLGLHAKYEHARWIHAV